MSKRNIILGVLLPTFVGLVLSGYIVSEAYEIKAWSDGDDGSSGGSSSDKKRKSNSGGGGDDSSPQQQGAGNGGGQTTERSNTAGTNNANPPPPPPSTSENTGAADQNQGQLQADQQQQQQQQQCPVGQHFDVNVNKCIQNATLLPNQQPQKQQITTYSNLVTNRGGIHAAVSWSPNPLKPKTQSTVNISFYDRVTSNPLSSNDVKYDMLILDKNSHPVITKQDLVAKNATDTQVVTFPSNDIYQIQLEIKELLKSGQTPDLTHNGIARGYVVVPEFPPNTAIPSIMIAGLFAVLIISSKISKRRSTV